MSPFASCLSVNYLPNVNKSLGASQSKQAIKIVRGPKQ